MGNTAFLYCSNQYSTKISTDVANRTLTKINPKHRATSEKDKLHYAIKTQKKDPSQAYNSKGEVKLAYRFTAPLLHMLRDRKVRGGHLIDIGSNDGVLSKLLKDHMEYSIMCYDVQDRKGGHLNGMPYMQNIAIDTISQGDQKADMISMMQSLHHITFIDTHSLYETLGNILYMLKVGGLFLIRDHDVYNIGRLNDVVTEHLVYSFTEDPTVDSNNYNDWYNHYNTKYPLWLTSHHILKKILEHYGLECLHFEYKKRANPSHIYNALYIKNKDVDIIRDTYNRCF